MGYDIENVGRAVEHLTHKVADLTEATTENVKEEKENAMGDAAVQRLERFAINHYTPTRTSSSGTTA